MSTASYVPRDSFYRRAREAGLRSRAAYKLLDLLRRIPRLAPGSAVVDLGCAPGGWLQILAEEVGPDGCVLGVDLQSIEPVESGGSEVRLLELDFTATDAPEKIEAVLGRPADVVLSDAAPKLTGIRDVDRASLLELYEGALRVADRVLRPQGWFILKGFPGPESDRFRAVLGRRFERVREVRPEGKRGTSKEFYWIAGPDRSARPRRAARRKPGR